MNSPKLSIVVICWNDADCILDCIASVCREAGQLSFEVIVSDNGSTDNSVSVIRQHYPDVRIIENGRNLGFGAGNNAGFRAARGEYVLILNPDTILQSGCLEKLVCYADAHPEGGAFGCRVLNPDGSLQFTAQPTPTVGGYLVAALYLRWLGRISPSFLSDKYIGWDGSSDRDIGFQAACCLLVRRELLQELGGFDETIPHQFEDADLCYRIWKRGKKVMFTHQPEITHIGGRNRGGYPIDVVLDTERSKCRFFQKHYGPGGVARIRWVSLISLAIRYCGYSLLRTVKPGQQYQARIQEYRTLLQWYWRLGLREFQDAGAAQPTPTIVKLPN